LKLVGVAVAVEVEEAEAVVEEALPAHIA